MNLAHGQGNPLLRLLLREHARFGIWHEHRFAHEIGCHRENEVGIGAVHLGQILLDHILVMSCRRLTRSGPQPLILLS